jgi:selenocysteine-specific elongation factor
MFTIGGGTVLDPSAFRHRRRRLDEGINRLDALHSGDQKKILMASMTRDGLPWLLPEMTSCLQVGMSEADAIARELTESGQLLALADGYFITAESFKKLCERLRNWLGDYSSRWPMRLGAPKKEAAQSLFPKMDIKQQRALFQCLDRLDDIEQDEKSIWLAGKKTSLTDEQKKIVTTVRGMYTATPLTPPLWSEVTAELGIPFKEQSEYLQWFFRSGELVRVADDLFYTTDALAEAERILRESAPDGYTLGEARDILGVSRKYAHRICEHFDLVMITYRDSEKHNWKS